MKQIDLTQGSIIKELTRLAMPIMGTSFLQMAYNLVDMIWIGKLGTQSVAAVGTAGFFMWFSFSLMLLSQIGAEVNVAQSIGAKNYNNANVVVKTAIYMTIIVGVVYGCFLILFKTNLVSFFNLGDSYVEGLAHNYLSIVAIGMPFTFFNALISGVYNGAGRSKFPFKVNSVGLVLNIILDPLFIFGMDLGVNGAAYATISSQIFVSILYITNIIIKNRPYEAFRLNEKPSFIICKKILKVSLPVSVQNGLFTIIAIFVARIIAVYGTTAIAVQKVGVQVEAISYMTAHGFATALSAFTGQNLGANKIARIKRGFKVAGFIMGGFGLLTSMVLYFGAGVIFKFFIDEPEALKMGIVYLQIIGLSQFFMCIEITMAGGLNGLGKSLPPAFISIGFNALRIPLSYVLSTYTVLRLNGIWWTLTVTSMVKGIVIVIVLVYILKRIEDLSIKESELIS